MVKLFLVCLAVCMAATSEALVKVGKCPGRVKHNMPLTLFKGTYTLCFLLDETYKELLNLLPPLIQPIIKITKVTIERIGNTGVLKIYIDNSVVPVKKIEITYEDEDSYFKYSGFALGDYTSGESYFHKCADQKILNEMCNSLSVNIGSETITVWIAVNGQCGTLDNWLNNNPCKPDLNMKKWVAIG